MYLLFGSNNLAKGLAESLSAKARVHFVTSARNSCVESVNITHHLVEGHRRLDDILSDIDEIPKGCILLDSNMLVDETPVELLRNQWPGVPLITTKSTGIQGGHEFLSPVEHLKGVILSRLGRSEQRDSAHALLATIRSISPNGEVSIFCHDNPDPDALASALALKDLVASEGRNSTIYYGGMVEHQSNLIMMKELDIRAKRLVLSFEVNDVLSRSDAIFTVDFHTPGANNVLPKDVVPRVVIDHHQYEDKPKGDVVVIHPEYGATSSLLATMLMDLNHQIDSRLATALTYGIRTDTLGFSRGFQVGDLRALSWLESWVDDEVLNRMESPPRSPQTLNIFSQALASMKQVGRAMISVVTDLHSRDALAQVADFLLNTEGVNTVFVFGAKSGKVVISARSRNIDINLADILSRAFPSPMAGGHKGVAGGQIPFSFILGFDEGEEFDMSDKKDEALSSMSDALTQIALDIEGQ